MTARNTGFTLVELILVLSLITMLSVSVIPVFRGTLYSVQDNHAVRDLVATMRYAQERAITDATEMRLYLEPEKNRYHIARLAAVDNTGKVFEPLAERFGETTKLPERHTLNKPDAKFDQQKNAYYITFRPNGACDLATVSIKKSDATLIQIKTNGNIARLTVPQ